MGICDITSVAQKIDLMYEWNTSRVLAEKTDFAKCNHPPVHPTPPQGHPHKTSIYKGATECKMALFSHRHSYPKQGYTQYQKIKNYCDFMRFSQAITPKKEPDRLKYSICSGLFFSFQYAPTICLRSACQLCKEYHPDSLFQGCIQKLSALYHLFHIFRCHTSHKSRNHHKRSPHHLIQ